MLRRTTILLDEEVYRRLTEESFKKIWKHKSNIKSYK